MEEDKFMKPLTSWSHRINLKMNFWGGTLIAFIAVCLLVSLGNLSIQKVEATALPAGIVQSVPITITNTQSMATPMPFQQMITVNSAAYDPDEAPNLQNVEFFDSTGAVIPSWLESGNSSTSTDTIYWLKLANGIPANSSITVYMEFAPPTTNLMNSQTTGEAAQLSPTYAQYDNGSNVFNAYDDFAESGLENNWVQDGGSNTANNGVTVYAADTGNCSRSGIIWANSNIYDQNVMIEVYSSISTSSGSTTPISVIPSNSPDSSSGVYNEVAAIDTGMNGGPSGLTWQNPASTLTHTDSFSSSNSVLINKMYVWGLASLQGGNYQAYQDYTTETPIVTDFNPDPQYVQIGGGDQSIESTFTQWFRERAYPPNGVMPNVSGISKLVSTAGQGGISPSKDTNSHWWLWLLVGLLVVVVAAIVTLLTVRRSKLKKSIVPMAEPVKTTASKNVPMPFTLGEREQVVWMIGPRKEARPDKAWGIKVNYILTNKRAVVVSAENQENILESCDFSKGVEIVVTEKRQESSADVDLGNAQRQGIGNAYKEFYSLWLKSMFRPRSLLTKRVVGDISFLVDGKANVTFYYIADPDSVVTLAQTVVSNSGFQQVQQPENTVTKQMVSEAAKYCRNCGKEVEGQAMFCSSCGVKIPMGQHFCQNCGQTTEPKDLFCVKCGVRLL
jgi:hypothetical protein